MVPRIEETDNTALHDDEPKLEPFRVLDRTKKPIVEEQNGTIHLELGEYRALILPIATVGITSGLCSIMLADDPDARMDGLPLLSNSLPVIIICLLYMCFSVVWGPRYMVNRAPIQLKKVKIVYNLIQVVLCSYIFIQAGRLSWFGTYSYRCESINRSTEGSQYEFTRIVYLYFLTKILDLADTIFFVLNKKFTHITFLHVFHHSGLVLGIYIGTKYTPGGHGTFIGFLNSFVHILMYSYYLLAAMGPAIRPYLWWKKYLTMVQITQFVIVFIHALQVFFIDCPIDKSIQAWCCIYAFIFFYLFVDFYRKEYKVKDRLKKEKAAVDAIHETKSNGTQINEHVMANGHRKAE